MFELSFDKKRSGCPFCGSDEIITAYKSEWDTLSASNDRCTNCRSIFQNPPLSREALIDIYDSEVYWNSSKNNNYIYTGYINQQRSYTHEAYRRASLIKKILQKPFNGLKILEIGCGAGFAAVPFLKAGADVTGVDPSREMAKYAKEKIGLNVLTEMFEELELSPISYDVAVTWGTSMSFFDPYAVYSKTGLLLKDGGSLFFDFFDMKGLFSFLTYRKRKKAVHASCAPSRKGIEMVLTRAGFHEVKFYRHFSYYSLSVVASQLDFMLLKSLFNVSPINRFGLLVPFPGTYIVHAIK